MDIDEYDKMEKTFEGRGSREVKEVENEYVEIVKSREEVQSRVTGHKSESNDYYRDGLSDRGNETRIRVGNRDCLEIIKSREALKSHSLVRKSDSDYDRDSHSKRFKYGSESRVRVANRDRQETMKSREAMRLDHKSDDSDYDRDGHSKGFKYGNEFRIRDAKKDRRETVKSRDDVRSHCLDHKSDDSDYDRDGHSKRFKRGDEFKFHDAYKDGQETIKFREEVRSHSLDHKSDDSDYDHDGHPKLFKSGNEFKTHDVKRDGQETIKSRREVQSHSLDHKSDNNEYDRDVHSMLFKYDNESRIRDAKDGVKSRREVRSRRGDRKSDGNDEVLSKRIKYGNESRIHDPSSGTDSSRHRSISRGGDRELPRGRAEHRDIETYRDRRRDREDTYGRDRERERYRDKGREKEWNRERDREMRGHEHDGERDMDVDREREHSCKSGTPSKSYQHPGETETGKVKDHECDWERRGRDHDGERGADLDREKGYSRLSGVPSESYQDRDETEKGTGKEYRQMDKDSIEVDNTCSSAKEDGADLEIDLLPCSRTKEDRAGLENDLSSCSRTKEDRVDLEASPECDQRTVLAYKISLKADKRDVYEFFSKAGKVQDVRLIMDSNPGISEGLWCIEFSDSMSVPMAIELSGQSLLGQPVMVKPSESENDLMQSTTAAADAGGLTEPYSEGPGRLYVGNLHVNIREDQLRQVFEPFGKVELVRLSKDRNEQCRGFGFVQFTRLDDSRNALTLDGNLEIAGRIIKVSTVTGQTRTLDVGANNADFVHNGYALSPNAHCLEMLVQKLDRDGTLSSISDILNTPIINSIGAPNLGTASFVSAQTLVQNSILAPAILLGTSIQIPAAEIPSIDTIGTPSECLLLTNMFDPKLETDPDFFLDVRKDVKEECSRFGNLKHVFVEKKSAGLVYIRFDDIKSAISAQHALHGRWLSGNLVTATFVDPQSYETRFPRRRWFS